MPFDISKFAEAIQKPTASREKIEELPLSSLLPDPENFYSMDGLSHLATNIQMNGLLDPIRVYANADNPETYTILSGHRRHAAIEILAMEEPEQWRTVPCIVDRDDIPKDARKLRLMMANLDTRKLTPYDLQQQANEMERCIVSLKEQGYAFPGRMQEYVAKALGTNKSKLAQLKIIDNGLRQELKERFKTGSLNVDQAYKLAHLSEEQQGYFVELSVDRLKNKSAVSIEDAGTKMKKLDFLECPKGGACTFLEQTKKNAVIDNTCCGCCCGCYKVTQCKTICEHAKAERDSKIKAADESAKRAREEREQRDSEAIAYISGIYERIRQARESAGMSEREFLRRLYGYEPSDEFTNEFIRHELGKDIIAHTMIRTSSTLLSANAIKNVMSLPETLGVSADWLLSGAEPKQCPNFGHWRTDLPEEPGRYLVEHCGIGTSLKFYAEMQFDGTEWIYQGMKLSELDYEARCWCRLPN